MGFDILIFTDTMENWDQEKLQSVVMSKHGNPRTTTDVWVIYVSSWCPFLKRVETDRVQIFRRGHRNDEVRPVNICSDLPYLETTIAGLDGFGNVQMERHVNIDMPYLQVSSSNLKGRRLMKRRKRTRSVLRNS